MQYLKNKYLNQADYLNADSDAIFLVRLIFYSLSFKCWGSTAVVLLVYDLNSLKFINFTESSLLDYCCKFYHSNRAMIYCLGLWSFPIHGSAVKNH